MRYRSGSCAIYGTFAAIVLTTFAIYFAPIGDFRVLTSVIVFGPAALVPDVRVVVVALVAGASMLTFEKLLARR